MDYKREVIDKLRCYESKCRSLHRIRSEISRLEVEFEHIRSASAGDTAVSGSGSTKEDTMISNIATRAELAKAEELTAAWIQIIDDARRSMSAEEWAILDGMYVHPVKGHVDRLCAALNVEKTTLYNRKNDALRKFTIELYGITEL